MVVIWLPMFILKIYKPTKRLKSGEFGTRVLAYGFLFNFAGNGNNSVVNYVEDEIAKPWFNQSLKAHTPDIITIIGHIGIRYDEFKAILKAVRAHHPTIPIAVLGGHT
ncbi:hypothetical protein G6F68_018474 [Rhizopus microsporus]|nr:hypothetical protein G6F68_018474 [Rhizopus microsporus]